jgi:hypothetical protein
VKISSASIGKVTWNKKILRFSITVGILLPFRVSSFFSYQSRITSKANLMPSPTSVYIGISMAKIKGMSIIDGHSVEAILHTISDSKSLDLFYSIAKGNVESKVLNETTGVSRKQCYTRIKQLLKSGLIKRSKGIFSLTCLGSIVYHAQLLIETGVKNYWKFKAIDSIVLSEEIEDNERTKLIKRILDDSKIESILVTQR